GRQPRTFRRSCALSLARKLPKTASYTTTPRPARASSMAADRPFGPEPITTSRTCLVSVTQIILHQGGISRQQPAGERRPGAGAHRQPSSWKILFKPAVSSETLGKYSPAYSRVHPFPVRFRSLGVGSL